MFALYASNKFFSLFFAAFLSTLLLYRMEMKSMINVKKILNLCQTSSPNSLKKIFIMEPVTLKGELVLQ